MKTGKNRITFESVNEGNYSVIDKKTVSESNTRIKKAMKPVIRTQKKKEAISKRRVAELDLNA